MIKVALRAEDNSRLFILGLSEDNIQALKQKHPIRINMSEIGGDGVVVIMWGETEAAIQKELEDVLELPESAPNPGSS